MRWLVALLALGAAGCMAEDEKPCTVHDGGKYYDLNPLKSNKDYELETPGKHLLVLNVCKRPVRETFGMKDVNDAEIEVLAAAEAAAIALNTTLSMQESNPRITLSNGSRCKSKSGDNQLRASTVIQFVCDTAVYGPGVPRLVAQLPPGDDEEGCAFFVEWRTHVACPTNEPGGAWGFFTFLTTLLVSLALVYLVAGTLYNRFVLNLRGIDQIPKFTLEGMRYHASEAIDWIKDLASSATERGSGYSGMSTENFGAPSPGGDILPRSAPSTAGMNPVSHQTQASASLSGEGGSGSETFVRPQPSRTTLGAARTTEINPISHQAQTSAQLAPSLPSDASSTPAPPPPVKKEKHRPKPFDLESTMQEREFMLGGDDDEDEEESAKPAAAAASEDPAVLRGRDMGAEGVTRL
ncbi:putative mannose 6-phosphate receptor domain-containing protein [Lyophyllum shimeji]|uniref:Autophagy-related protein 27 n=1 Tax=Lyophyllum shimeji TaxID=47721 RepID=A0A9P3PZ41_LYOSH|nr:putative mannose 6-phosphate receptor domain-containing protein [Lyophyllum shimeji]GLB45939.1 putative mannose 6-phosphate receptor domain-containing protein [Lyophyllum shimeji]